MCYNEQKCDNSFHRFLNRSKWFIYTQQFEFYDEFKEHLLEACTEIHEAEVATFIKPRYEETTAILLTFNWMKTLYSPYIPRERADTIVYTYVDRPMICNKCFKYGNTKNRCSQEEKISKMLTNRP